ncbi:hypothetical protein [Ferruginibacter sp. HRS2-29]|uniref:hypothetical protein n=1 Tax=Ferruginibacter sp. HRS2-29 TaxID=2487334 RepID=UPI0020CD8C69|nr:hypothetical protein [Ferruginibacter sp. HRS2-29]MCP9752956.1 hypothetical protein [Ferruginibacter sp. HRS2-29]
MKGLSVFILTMAVFATTVSAQRVMRKGTRPQQLTPKGSDPDAVKTGKNIFSLSQVQGKWQEAARRNLGSSEKLSYTDTLMIHISNDKAEVREGMSMNMKGDAAVEEGDNLSVAADVYIIRKIENDQMLLDDGEYLRTMQKVQTYYLETVGKDSIKHAGYKLPQTVLTDNLYGKWIVYRREAKPGAINSQTELVKSITILKGNAGSASKGEIVIYSKDLSEKLDCFVTLKDDNMEVVTKNKSWNFKTYLADNNEFVFGQAEEVMNYSKRLVEKVNGE